MYINFVRAMLDEKKIKNYHFSCNKDAIHWSEPIWNSVNLHSINDQISDKAQDNKHPGVLSHKSISHEVIKKINNYSVILKRRV